MDGGPRGRVRGEVGTGDEMPSGLGVELEDSLTYFRVVEVAFGAGDDTLPSGLHLPSDVTCGWAGGCRDRDCVSAKAERPASSSLRNASGGGASLPSAGLRWEEPPPPAHQLDPGRPAHPRVGENTPGGRSLVRLTAALTSAAE